MENNNQVVIMARVSSDDQAKGYSLDVQKEALEKYCENNNLTIAHIIREDHSAKTFNRPAFKEFLEIAKKNKGKFTQLLFTSWDRFSRNATQAFAMIDRLRNMGIECNAIEQALDMKVPENKLILSVYLTIPEIDNDRRSIKIKGGMRGALKAGRWCRNAPLGYKNSRDMENKPIIIPDNSAIFIKKAFKLIASGYSQSDVLSTLKKEPINLTKSNLSRILRNPIYNGKIVVPSIDDEPERVINGIHDGLVSDVLFYKVQNILSRKSNKLKVKKSEREELPLRGFLSCGHCGKIMTGSGSRSQTGRRYFYYHCRGGCKKRFFAERINKNIESIIEMIQFPEEQIELFSKIIENVIREQEKISITNRNSINSKLILLKEQQDKLDSSFLSSEIDHEMYNRLSKKIKLSFDQTKLALSEIKLEDNNIKLKIKRKVKELQNLSVKYCKSKVSDKRKLISSIFPEKIEISNGVCRTIRLNSVVNHILLKMNKVSVKNKGQTQLKLSLSRLVESAGVFSSFNLSLRYLSQE